ncbi:unnamed protein product [Arctogadus glacialis]
MRANPAVFFNFFVNEGIPLQAKDLCKLFVPDFSVQGSNRRNRENATICFWCDWLIDIEEGECSPVTLERVLEFSSGVSKVPPLGFPHPPQIQCLLLLSEDELRWLYPYSWELFLIKCRQCLNSILR